MNYTYILECSDGTLYTGWTNNLEKRIKDHNSGTIREKALNTPAPAFLLPLSIMRLISHSRRL